MSGRPIRRTSSRACFPCRTDAVVAACRRRTAAARAAVGTGVAEGAGEAVDVAVTEGEAVATADKGESDGVQYQLNRSQQKV